MTASKSAFAISEKALFSRKSCSVSSATLDTVTDIVASKAFPGHDAYKYTTKDDFQLREFKRYRDFLKSR